MGHYVIRVTEEEHAGLLYALEAALNDLGNAPETDQALEKLKKGIEDAPLNNWSLPE